MAGLIIKLTQDRFNRRITKFNHVHEGLVEMGLKKWSNHKPFTLFRQKSNKFMRN